MVVNMHCSAKLLFCSVQSSPTLWQFLIAADPGTISVCYLRHCSNFATIQILAVSQSAVPFHAFSFAMPRNQRLLTFFGLAASENLLLLDGGCISTVLFFSDTPKLSEFKQSTSYKRTERRIVYVDYRIRA